MQNIATSLQMRFGEVNEVISTFRRRTFIYSHRKTVWSRRYQQRKQSNTSALHNDEWVTADHTKLDNHTDMEKADSQTKENWCFYEGTACRRRIWEFHFSSLAILTHPPTIFAEHTEPWREKWAARRLPLTTVGEVPTKQRGGQRPCFHGKPFSRNKHQVVPGTVGLCGRRRTAKLH